MRLSLSTFAFIKYTIEEAFENTRRLGYDAVEIVANRPHLYPPDYSPAGRKKLLSLLTSLELPVSAIAAFNGTPQWNLTHPNPRVRSDTIRHIKDCLDLADHFGAPVVEVVSGVPVLARTDKRMAWRWLRDSLRNCAEYAERLGKVIGLESEPGNFLDSTKSATAMIDELDTPNVKFLIDVGHVNASGEDVIDSIAMASGRIAHVHLDDNHGTSDEHLVPGDGNIDFRQVIRALGATGYDGYLSVELEQAREADESASRSITYLRKILSL